MLYIMHRNTLPIGTKGSHVSVTSSVESQPSPTPQDNALMQQLLLEQQKQQTLLLNQQELLVGLQEGHKELMEKVQHKEDTDNHNSEREWWIKKLLEQSSVPATVSHKNNALRSQSFPNLENSSQGHLIGYSKTAIFSNTAIGIRSQIISNEKSFVSNNFPYKEPSVEETVLESPVILAQASVAVEASADMSPTHSPTYQSCGTNTHNLVDAGVNTAPLTVDICIGTEWAISSSSEDESDQSKTEASPQTAGSSDTSPQGKVQHTTTTTTEKESQSEGSAETQSQPQATTATITSGPDHSSHHELTNQEVLARSIDGYYYWGVVLQYNHQQDLYIVEDLDSRQQLMMGRSDFITETQDAARAVLQLYDRALAPRVLSPNCFLPGRCAPREKEKIYSYLFIYNRNCDGCLQ